MSILRTLIVSSAVLLALCFAPVSSRGAQAYLDNETLYSNQDPDTETRRSDHFRICFGHYNRDTGTPITEQLVQGNLQMFEQMWNRWIVEMGLSDINESATKPDGNKYRANFNFLMSWDDGGGGGAYSSMDGNGFFYAMANSGYARFDPPSGATPHEFGHVWEGSAAGFNGSDSSGAWWECMANWMQLQFLNSYPQCGAYLENPMYYPAHGRNYYDAFMIWETALEDPRYGTNWINEVWSNATPAQRTSEFIIDRMIRVDSSGQPDKAGATKDLWGDMAKKMITFDYQRQRWLATANRADDGTDWNFYQRARTPLVALPTQPGWFRPARSHLPMQYGFNIIPLQASPNTKVTCNFNPQPDPVRQSDWRACLVAVNSAGIASYSTLWNKGSNSIQLSADQSRLYLTVIATPKPMKIADPAWKAYITDAGLQFPYAVSFTNAAPKNVIYPPQSRTGMIRHTNGGGWKATTATVDATAYIGPDAQVLNSAQVRGYARIEDFAVVRNNARVRDNAVVSGHAEVRDNAQVYGNAKVRDWARVFGHVEVFENARVIEHANCGDGDSGTHTKVYGDAIIKGTTYVYNTSTFNGCLIMDGDSANGNGTSPHSKGVHFGWGWGADTARFNALADNGYLFARHSFEKDNAVFAMDEYGINHGFLMNGCKIANDQGTTPRSGRILPLNGTNHYVELHNATNDFFQGAVSIWFKHNGGDPDQRIWSMGNGSAKEMYLTPNDAATGTLRFVITNGTTSHSLTGPAIAARTWQHASVVFAPNTITLYLNGQQVAAETSATIFPDDLNAPMMENANFLGRGPLGEFFAGAIDDFRLHLNPLTPSEVAALFSAAQPAANPIAADSTPPTTPSWLEAPRQIADNAVTMSATPATDASNWVEYQFTCLSGGGHDSGWMASNKYTDTQVTPGANLTYSVQCRDRAGNTTPPSATASVTPTASTLPTPSFAYGPVGIANGQITMTAAVPANTRTKIEYRFDRTSPTPSSSGWQSSPTYTQTGLTTGSSYNYTVTLRDGSGVATAPSAPASATARDDAGPLLPPTFAHWQMLPYATIDNKISMTAQTASDPSGVEYRFTCTSGGGPNSNWQSSSTFLTPVLPDGTYVYQYQVRDRSTRANLSPASTSYPATITPTTGYHNHTLTTARAAADDHLVSFPATVMKVNADHYLVKDLASGEGIAVKPSTYGLATDPALALRNVNIKGHMYTFSGTRVVTYATLTTTGAPALYTVSGRVINASGTGVAGATIAFSDTSDPTASPIVTTTTDANGYYSRGLTSGLWFVAASASAYNTGSDREVTVSGAAVGNINFQLNANAPVSGTVTRRTDGSPVQGAKVHFSRSPGAAAAPTFTATTDANGRYSQPVQDGTWYVAAEANGFLTSPDMTVTVLGANIEHIHFSLKSNQRDFPRPDDLLLAALTDSLPSSGTAGNWSLHAPQNASLTPIGARQPTVATIDGAKWTSHLYADSSGFRYLKTDSAIPINGATIVVAAKPLRNTQGTSWTSIVDLFYNRLVLGIRNSTGRIDVCRNGNWRSSSTAIPSGQTTILSVVVQPTGQYKVFANGIEVINETSTSAMTSLVPNVAGPFANGINIGRNDPDGWSTFNGNIGDALVYKVALTAAERQQAEADLSAKFRNSDPVITATAQTGGVINPSGSIRIAPASTQTFTITPQPGKTIANVSINGSPIGPVTSHTFTNVTANQSITATFTDLPSNQPPVITTGPAATPATVTTTSTKLSLAATDDAGTANLTCTWEITSAPPGGSVTFSPATHNPSQETTATFSQPGNYTLAATVTDPQGLSATATTSVSVIATATSINPAPATATLPVHQSLDFSASVLDQFGRILAAAPLAWAVDAGGIITTEGRFTATTPGGPFRITATSGTTSASATIVITKATASVTLDQLSHIHDGSPKHVRATTSPEGLTTEITYNGSTTPPTTPGNYTATAIIQDSHYAGSATATLVIVPLTYPLWQASQFSAENITSGTADPLADPDGDGLPNLGEYALGSDPATFTRMPAAILTENALVLDFAKPTFPSDVLTTAEASSNLTDWHPVPITLRTDGPVQQLRASQPLNPGPGPLQVIRLRFTLQ